MHRPYENEVHLLYIPKDVSNEHKHCGLHPYIVLKNYGTTCVVIPCSSVIQKRNLPTHVRLQTKMPKKTVALVEQMTSVDIFKVETGSYMATLCDEDIETVWSAVSIQLGVTENTRQTNKLKGKIFNVTEKFVGSENISLSEYVVISNEKCNKHSPVVHIAPITESIRENYHSDDCCKVYKKNGEAGYISIRDIRLVSKEYLMQTNASAIDELKNGSIYAWQKSIEERMSACH